jgi:hypothetical protein
MKKKLTRVEMVECVWCHGTKKEVDGVPCRLCKQTGRITKAEKEHREKLVAWEGKMQLEYMQTTLNRYTFSNKRIRAWVEENCTGLVLNLFAGETLLNLNEVRNDLREEAPAHFHKDALCFVNQYIGEKFDVVLLDPPYSYRKSMEMYAGKITSPFNALKDGICTILKDTGCVITFGYHSVSMGKKRGFVQSKILLMSHGGAIHDTIAVIEKKEEHPCAERPPQDTAETVAAIQAARMVKTDPGGAIATLGDAIENNVKVQIEQVFNMNTNLRWLKERGL